MRIMKATYPNIFVTQAHHFCHTTETFLYWCSLNNYVTGVSLISILSVALTRTNHQASASGEERRPYNKVVMVTQKWKKTRRATSQSFVLSVPLSPAPGLPSQYWTSFPAHSRTNKNASRRECCSASSFVYLFWNQLIELFSQFVCRKR